jgi:hypothetical protein
MHIKSFLIYFSIPRIYSLERREHTKTRAREYFSQIFQQPADISNYYSLTQVASLCPFF